MELYNLEFTEQEIRAATAANRLLSMEIEFSRLCNFRCVYCYLEDKHVSPDDLKQEEIRDILQQAKALGARKIIILGGEPSIYPHLIWALHLLAELGLEIEIFTNGSGVNKELARALAETRSRVVLKMNSRDPELQDRLAGRKGAAVFIQRALDTLQKAGYPSSDLFLAASTVICRPNLNELPELWRWLRGNRIEPYFEVLTPQSNAAANTWLDVEPAELHALFIRLSEIDRSEFDRHWQPQPPLVGNRCMRHQVSCVVTAGGDVLPCVGITVPQGNIRSQSLAEILRQSEIVKNLKNYRKMIKGACGSCDKSEECYGCRGAAFQLTGDYLASDPTCWRNCQDTLK